MVVMHIIILIIISFSYNIDINTTRESIVNYIPDGTHLQQWTLHYLHDWIGRRPRLETGRPNGDKDPMMEEAALPLFEPLFQHVSFSISKLSPK